MIRWLWHRIDYLLLISGARKPKSDSERKLLEFRAAVRRSAQRYKRYIGPFHPQDIQGPGKALKLMRLDDMIEESCKRVSRLVEDGVLFEDARKLVISEDIVDVRMYLGGEMAQLFREIMLDTPVFYMLDKEANKALLRQADDAMREILQRA